MIKRYYSLDDAIVYLSEKSGIRLTGHDLFDHIQANRLRLCTWYAGFLARVRQDRVFEFDHNIISFHPFRGYLTGAPLRGWLITHELIDGTNPNASYQIGDAKIIESCVGNLPSLSDDEGFSIWDTSFANRKHIGLTLWEAGDKESPEGFDKIISLRVDRARVLIPATDLDSLLAGRQRADALPATDTEQAEAETKRNWSLITGALLELLTKDGRRNKAGIVTELADLGIRGLGQRTLEGAFAEASKAYGERRKE